MDNKVFYNNLWRESPMGRQHLMRHFGIFVVACVVLLLCSCATKKQIEYIDREVVKYKTLVTHDTITNNIHDSVRIATKGDTVFVDRWHREYRDKISIQHDTCWRDSVRTEYKDNVVEKEIIPNWCYYSLVVCVLLIIFAIIKVILWLKTT